MSETISKLMIEAIKGNILAIAISVICITIVSTWYISKFANNLQSNKENIDKLNKDFHSYFADMRQKIDLIYNQTTLNPTLQRNSPLALSEIGQEISTKLKIDDILHSICEKNENEMSEIGISNNSYDIQVASSNWVKNNLMDKLEEENILDIKNEAYEKGILESDIYDIYAIKLRDKIIKKISIDSSHS